MWGFDRRQRLEEEEQAGKKAAEDDEACPLALQLEPLGKLAPVLGAKPSEREPHEQTPGPGRIGHGLLRQDALATAERIDAGADEQHPQAKGGGCQRQRAENAMQ